VVLVGTQVYPFSAYTEGRFRGYTGRKLTMFDGYQNVDADDGVITEATIGWIAGGGDAHDRSRGAHRGGALGRVRDRGGPPHSRPGPIDDPRIAATGLGNRPSRPRRDPSPRSGRRAQGDVHHPAMTRTSVSACPHIPLAGLATAASSSALYGAAAGPARGSSSTYTAPHSLSLHQAAPGGRRDSTPSAASSATARRDQRTSGARSGRPRPGRRRIAEARYVETMALSTQQLARFDAFAFERLPWDLLVTYLPFPDEALHRGSASSTPPSPVMIPRSRAACARISTACWPWSTRTSEGGRRRGADAIVAVCRRSTGWGTAVAAAEAERRPRRRRPPRPSTPPARWTSRGPRGLRPGQTRLPS
jgi:hypothetical protein